MTALPSAFRASAVIPPLATAERMAARLGTDVIWATDREAARGGPGLSVAPLQVWGPLRDRLLAVLGASAALGDHLVRHPEHWPALDEPAPAHPRLLRAALLETVGADPTADVPVAAGASHPLLERPVDARHVHGDDGMADLGWPAPTLTADPRHAVVLERRADTTHHAGDPRRPEQPDRDDARGHR